MTRDSEMCCMLKVMHTVTLKAAGLEVCFSSGWMSISVFFAGSQTVWANIVAAVVVLAPPPWQWYIGWRFRICCSAEMTGSFRDSSFAFCLSLSLFLSWFLPRFFSPALSPSSSVSFALFPSWFGALHSQLWREWEMEWGLQLPYFGVILILHERYSVANI